MVDAFKWIIVGIIVFTVVYIILKAIAINEEYNISQQTIQIPREIEIISKDLRLRAENLIATHEVYALQVEQLVIDINKIEDILEANKKSKVLKMSETEVRALISESLTLQDKKCRLESKIIKIIGELDKIAMEEYKRQLTM